MKFTANSDTSFVPARAQKDDEFPKEAGEFWEDKRQQTDLYPAQVEASRKLDAAPDCPCACDGCAEAEHCGGPDCLVEEV